jgi:dTDP-4-dehydrorhamnose reductase
MLGGTVLRHLQGVSGIQVRGTARRADADDLLSFDVDSDIEAMLEELWAIFPADLVINAIGVLNRYCRDDDPVGVRRATRINALFPHDLNAAIRSRHPEARVIHATTDCVYSGRDGPYDEHALHDPVDFYGRSKSLGEVQDHRWLNLRCSIIGPEADPRGSLLDWFLSQPRGATLQGYAHHHWNGVTTLQFAQLCERLADPGAFDALRAMGHTVHYCPNEAVSKFELLGIFNEIWDRGCRIDSVSGPGPAVDRRLASVLMPIDQRPMAEAVLSLKVWMDTESPGAP